MLDEFLNSLQECFQLLKEVKRNANVWVRKIFAEYVEYCFNSFRMTPGKFEVLLLWGAAIMSCTNQSISKSFLRRPVITSSERFVQLTEKKKIQIDHKFDLKLFHVSLHIQLCRNVSSSTLFPFGHWGSSQGCCVKNLDGFFPWTLTCWIDYVNKSACKSTDKPSCPESCMCCSLATILKFIHSCSPSWWFKFVRIFSPLIFEES